MSDNQEQNGDAGASEDRADGKADADTSVVNAADSTTLAAIGAALAQAGFAPAGEYDIAQVAETVISKYADLSAQVDDLGAAIIALDLRGTEDAGACEIAALRLKELVAARKTLTRQARSATRDPQAKARKLPKEPPALGDIEDMFDRIDAAVDVQIVAMHDGAEDLRIAPLCLLDGSRSFRIAGGGLCLAVDRWEVTGPAQVAGWALYLDGTLAAWRPRPNGDLPIGAGQTFNLAGDVIF